MLGLYLCIRLEYRKESRILGKGGGEVRIESKINEINEDHKISKGKG